MTMISDERYSVQKRLDEIGDIGQRRLKKATILVVGAGGLGCALLPWLVGAGVGRIHVMDGDDVALSNLHRQTLYHMDDIGKPKAEMICQHLHKLNPDIQLLAHTVSAQPDNVVPLIEESVVVIDAADNFAATYMLNDLCRDHKRVFLSGSATGWEGYAGVFCGGGPSYRAVFPDMAVTAQNCGQGGVLGPVVGMMGSLLAQFCLSLILDIEPSPLGELRRWNALTARLSRFSFHNASDPQHFWPFLAQSQLQDDDVIVDVRLLDEEPALAQSNVVHKPLPDFKQSYEDIPRDKRVVLCCATGLRAAKAATWLEQKGYQNLALMALKGQCL